MKLIQCGGNTSTNIYSIERKTCFINHSQIQIKTIRKLYKIKIHVLNWEFISKKNKLSSLFFSTQVCIHEKIGCSSFKNTQCQKVVHFQTLH